MLAKTVKKDSSDWDKHLPYVLYAYRTSLQESTKESPFFLLYGRDYRLPTDQALSPQPPCDVLDVDTYKSEVSWGLSAVWKLAREQVQKAQCRQKTQHDRHVRDPGFCIVDLSAPSVNDAIRKDICPLSYISIDDVAQIVIHHGKRPYWQKQI